MQRSRFVFVQSVTPLAAVGPSGGRLLWLLVSSNNRRLGQDAVCRESYAECRAAVTRLRDGHARLRAHIMTDQRDGRRTWQLSLGGVTVATSSRSYLRHRECDYNLRRFLDAVAEADVVPGTRRVTVGRPPADREYPTDARRAAGVRSAS